LSLLSSSVVAGVCGLPDWPELVVALVQALDSGSADAVDGALDALYKARHRAGRRCLV